MPPPTPPPRLCCSFHTSQLWWQKADPPDNVFISLFFFPFLSPGCIRTVLGACEVMSPPAMAELHTQHSPLGVITAESAWLVPRDGGTFLHRIVGWIQQMCRQTDERSVKLWCFLCIARGSSGVFSRPLGCLQPAWWGSKLGLAALLPVGKQGAIWSALVLLCL